MQARDSNSFKKNFKKRGEEVYPDKNLDFKELKEKAKEIRRDIIRSITEAGSGHPGGSLSCADIMTALFFSTMTHDSGKPSLPERDRFILSKGHAAPTLYACLARTGYLHEEELLTLRKLKSRLQGHPSRLDLPIIECSSGSLGQGLGVAAGMALASKIDNRNNSIFCLMGDGEQDEGAVWEAVMFSKKYKLDNLCAIIDENRFQLDGPTSKIMDLSPIHKKYKSFGWRVIKVDGHNIRKLVKAFHKFKRLRGRGQPVLVIAKTVKGKGVSFMENNDEWHGKAPTKQEAEKALAELK
jgi:transketolase